MRFDAELANNPEPRLACVLLLDTSGSMGGAPIHELNAGFQVFKEEINEDSLARKRVEVAIVTFGGGVGVAQGFQTVNAFQPPRLTANGDTPMGAAINQALDLVRSRSSRSRGLPGSCGGWPRARYPSPPRIG